MDSVTQIVLGAAVSEAILGPKIGNRAALYGGIIGTIPDLDIFVGKLYDPITALEIHRGFSHSILFFALFAPVLGWAVSRLERRLAVTFSQATLMAFLCLLTHAVLDAFTTWGTQLFWPHPYRAGVQSIFVIDPLYTLPFIFCVIMAMRLPKSSGRRRMWNRTGLLLSTVYLTFTVCVQYSTKVRFESSLKQRGISYDRLIVKPSPFNIILWNANVATANGYWLGDYSYFDHSPISYRFYPHNRHLIGDIAEDKTIRQLIHISEGWYIITERDGKLYFNDLRFGLINDDIKNPEFAFSYEIINDGTNISAREVDNKGRREGVKLLQRLWTRLKGQ